MLRAAMLRAVLRAVVGAKAIKSGDGKRKAGDGGNGGNDSCGKEILAGEGWEEQ